MGRPPVLVSYLVLLAALLAVTLLVTVYDDGLTFKWRTWAAYNLSTLDAVTRRMRIQNTIKHKNCSEIYDDLVKLVLSLANIHADRNTGVVAALRVTLNLTVHHLTSLLGELQDFKEQYRCPSCSDTRPPPRTVLSVETRLEHNLTWNGYSLPILAVTPLGRLGNVMGEYATVYALNRIYNVTALMTPAHEKVLGKIFPNLTLPVVKTDNNWRRLEATNTSRGIFSYPSLELAAAGLLGPHRFITTNYPFEKQLFHAYRSEIQRELTFNDHLIDKANTRLTATARNATKVNNETVTFIGVHVRLTDYTSYMRKYGLKSVSYASYLGRAMKHYEDLHDNPVFVVTTDDKKKVRKIFKNFKQRNVFIYQGETPEEDMCLLAHCNHSIITLGSFSFWTGYLSPGTTVYPDIEALLDPNVTYFLSRDSYEASGFHNFIPLPL